MHVKAMEVTGYLEPRKPFATISAFPASRSIPPQAAIVGLRTSIVFPLCSLRQEQFRHRAGAELA
jgi:hypothetical protein